MSSTGSQILHLVYIHGFQGSDASFQAFPTDLQTYLASQIPSGSPITIRSSVYPTYKSARPLSYAVKNFLEWLSLQPPGPVILLGHSMGGLLAAEAAMDSSSTTTSAQPRRITGVIAFDTPYLGMHPHVVKSGILSLFSKKEDQVRQHPPEAELNPHPDVKVVDPEVTEDWEKFKRDLHTKPPRPRPSPLTSPEPSPPTTRSTTQESVSTSKSSTSESPNRPPTNILLSITSLLDDPRAKWLQKHSQAPLAEGKKWVVEQLQFAGSMFDPNGLSARYTKLVEWGQKGGLWVNFWTQTVPKAELEPGTPPPSAAGGGGAHQKGHSHSQSLGANDPGLKPTESSESISSVSSAGGAMSDSGTHPEKNAKKKSYHFVVLPNGLGSYLGGFDRWESVVIEGVKDEVAAHTGIFIREHNLGYEAFVRRVAGKVINWTEGM